MLAAVVLSVGWVETGWSRICQGHLFALPVNASPPGRISRERCLIHHGSPRGGTVEGGIPSPLHKASLRAYYPPIAPARDSPPPIAKAPPGSMSPETLWASWDHGGGWVN